MTDTVFLLELSVHPVEPHSVLWKVESGWIWFSIASVRLLGQSHSGVCGYQTQPRRNVAQNYAAPAEIQSTFGELGLTERQKSTPLRLC